MALNVVPRAVPIVEAMAALVLADGGIIIPDTAQEKPQQGKGILLGGVPGVPPAKVLIAVGPGTKENPVTVKVGDTVLYGKYSGTELKLESNDYLIIRIEEHKRNNLKEIIVYYPKKQYGFKVSQL